MKLSMKERPTYFSPWAKPYEPGRDWLPAPFTNHSALKLYDYYFNVILISLKVAVLGYLDLKPIL